MKPETAPLIFHIKMDTSRPDLLISLLVEINCLFLAGWVLVLAAAFVLSFPEKLWVAQPPKSKVFAESRRRE